MGRFLQVQMMEDALAHHGIKGQKWGIRNAEWYPISEWKKHLNSESHDGKKNGHKIMDGYLSTVFGNKYTFTNTKGKPIVKDRTKYDFGMTLAGQKVFKNALQDKAYAKAIKDHTMIKGEAANTAFQYLPKKEIDEIRTAWAKQFLAPYQEQDMFSQKDMEWIIEDIDAWDSTIPGSSPVAKWLEDNGIDGRKMQDRNDDNVMTNIKGGSTNLSKAANSFVEREYSTSKHKLLLKQSLADRHANAAFNYYPEELRHPDEYIKWLKKNGYGIKT